jgi:hypothetical protein
MAKQSAEVFLMSNVDLTLVIPKEKRGFPNEVTLTFYFKAGVPQKVPVYVAKSYSESNSYNFSIIKEEDVEGILSKVGTTNSKVNDTPASNEFNAIEFLNNQHPLTQDKLENLDDAQLFKIANVLELPINQTFPKLRVIEIILAEIDARNNNA